MRSLILPISFERSIALSYLPLSLSCLTLAVSASQTYFAFFVRSSIQLASHVASRRWTISFQSPAGTVAFLPRLSVTSAGVTLRFHLPLSGCAPRPMNIPGGSAM